MRNTTKLGATSLISLAALMSGCAPMMGNNPPAASGNTYNAGTTAPANNYNDNYNANTGGTSYDYGSGGGSYGGTYANDNSNSNYYAGNNSSSYGSYGSTDSNYNSGGSYGSSYSGGSNGNVSGSYAVQVIASGNRGTAENMVGQMQSYGFTATIDQVGGYFKVRIPYSSEGEAKSNLGRIRSYVPDAFYTVR